MTERSIASLTLEDEGGEGRALAIVHRALNPGQASLAEAVEAEVAGPPTREGR